jgi:hypothetical protein
MSTFALWYEPANEASTEFQPVAEFHLNVWKPCTRRKQRDPFVDIGIKLKKADGIGELKLFLPETSTVPLNPQRDDCYDFQSELSHPE